MRNLFRVLAEHYMDPQWHPAAHVIAKINGFKDQKLRRMHEAHGDET